ncbi:MAG: NYN domain-containing protein [Holophagales bacterium]|nr:NYN domain-containing protein [Holophagales bacterium]
MRAPGPEIEAEARAERGTEDTPRAEGDHPADSGKRKRRRRRKRARAKPSPESEPELAADPQADRAAPSQGEERAESAAPEPTAQPLAEKAAEAPSAEAVPDEEPGDAADAEAGEHEEALADESLAGDPLGGSLVYVPERAAGVTDERKIALFIDFENVAIGVRDSEIKTFDLGLMLERLLEKGKIIVKRAYADWERYSEHKRPLHEAAIELIDIPEKRYSGKNSADIKLVVDAMDLCYSKEHLDTFVLITGDSDFSPLVSKLKENDKYVIAMGVKNASSPLLIDNCDEFIYYEDVWRDSQRAPRLDHLPKKEAACFQLMAEAMQALFRENKDVIWGSMLKQTMKRKRPSFAEGYYGYGSFSELLEDAERKGVIRLRRDRRSGSYIVAGFAPRSKR